MKKFLIAMALAACAFCTQAANTQEGLGFEVNSLPKGAEATDPSTLQYYSMYSLSSSQLQEISGLKSLTISSVQTWLKDNALYYTKQSAITAEGNEWYIKRDAYGQDMTKTGSSSGFLLASLLGDTSRSDNEWIFAFYEEDGNVQFRIAHLQNTSDTNYGDKYKASSSGTQVGLAVDQFVARGGGTYAEFVSWTGVSPTEPRPIPEPTSAVLMLLGLAGLALKRKQA